MTDVDVTETEMDEATGEVYDIICDMDDPGDGAVQVIAKDTKTKKEARIYYTFGEDLDDMIELFGADVVASQAIAQMKVKLQAAMRSYLKTGHDVASLTENWKPGVALERRAADPAAAAENAFKNMSAEEQDAFIAKLLEAKQG